MKIIKLIMIIELVEPEIEINNELIESNFNEYCCFLLKLSYFTQIFKLL